MVHALDENWKVLGWIDRQSGRREEEGGKGPRSRGGHAGLGLRSESDGGETVPPLIRGWFYLGRQLCRDESQEVVTSRMLRPLLLSSVPSLVDTAGGTTLVGG